MRLNIKNFDTDTHKITWELNEVFMTLFYWKRENGVEYMDRVFIKYMVGIRDSGNALKELLGRAEKHYGIELLKPQFKIEQTQLN